MRVLRVCLAIPLALLLVAGCGSKSAAPTKVSAEPSFNLDEIVRATLEALTAQATVLLPGAASETPAPAAPSWKGSISGSLTYPADSLPPMYIVAYEIGTDDHPYVTTEPGQGKY